MDPTAPLMALIRSPGGRRILEQLQEYAPHILKNYQKEPLAEAIERGGMMIENREPLAIMDPRGFETLSPPIPQGLDDTRGRIDNIQKILRAADNPEARTDPFDRGVTDSLGNAFDAPGRDRRITNPGLNDISDLTLSQHPGGAGLQVDDHGGRHTSRALSEQGVLDTLVRLQSDHPERGRINELLYNRDSDIYQQPLGEEKSKYAGQIGNLMKILAPSVGGLALLPEERAR